MTKKLINKRRLISFISTSLLTTLIITNTLCAEPIGAKNPPVTPNPILKQINDGLVSVSTAVIPSVVYIEVQADTKKNKKNESDSESDDMSKFFKFFNMPEDNSPRMGAGSGVIISSDGYIVTNNHVVDFASENGITVFTTDKKKYKGKVIGTDPLTDLAVIKIEAQNLQPAHLGNMDDIRIGELVIAVGNPMGLNSTVTQGIISAIGRGKLSPNSSEKSIENYVQTDAAINPGNSGGGLFNSEGSLIGINTLIASQTGSYIGYGFAIPVDLVKAVAEDLIDNGKINRGLIGVMISNVDEVFAKKLGMKEVYGALVQEIVKDGAAEKADILPMDVITELNGKKINTSNELQGFLALYRAGEKVNLKIIRDGKEIERTVTLKAMDKNESDDLTTNAGEDFQKPVEFEKLGIDVAPLTDAVKKQFNVDYGVYISGFNPYGQMAQRGLFAKGVIQKIDKQEIKSVKEFKKAIESKNSGDIVLMEIKYENRSQILAIELP